MNTINFRKKVQLFERRSIIRFNLDDALARYYPDKSAMQQYLEEESIGVLRSYCAADPSTRGMGKLRKADLVKGIVERYTLERRSHENTQAETPQEGAASH
jgi:hypothetical protein